MINNSTPNNQFSKFLDKNGLKHRTFRALRHTSATFLVYSGADIKVVKERLGHSDINTTNQYLEMVKSADRDAVDRLDMLLLPKTSDTAEEQGDT